MVRWVYLSGYIASLIWSWTLLDLAHLMSYERLVFSALTSDTVFHVYTVHPVCPFVCGYLESRANLHCQSCTDKRTQELQSGDANSFQRCKPRRYCNQSNSNITILIDMTCFRRRRPVNVWMRNSTTLAPESFKHLGIVTSSRSVNSWNHLIHSCWWCFVNKSFHAPASSHAFCINNFDLIVYIM